MQNGRHTSKSTVSRWWGRRRLHHRAGDANLTGNHNNRSMYKELYPGGLSADSLAVYYRRVMRVSHYMNNLFSRCTTAQGMQKQHRLELAILRGRQATNLQWEDTHRLPQYTGRRCFFHANPTQVSSSPQTTTAGYGIGSPTTALT